MNDFLSISGLVEEFQVTIHTIRFYEDRALISPLCQGTWRLFCPRDCTRLKLILRGKRLGSSLVEIAGIIGTYNAALGEGGQLPLLIGDCREQLRQQLLVI